MARAIIVRHIFAIGLLIGIGVTVVSWQSVYGKETLYFDTLVEEEDFLYEDNQEELIAQAAEKEDGII